MHLFSALGFHISHTSAKPSYAALKVANMRLDWGAIPALAVIVANHNISAALILLQELEIDINIGPCARLHCMRHVGNTLQLW